MQIAKGFKKLVELKKLIGMRRLLQRLIYFRADEVIQRIDLADLGLHSPKNRLKVYEVKKEHLDKMYLLAKRCGVIPGDFNAYLNHGCKGLVIETNGEVIGYTWWGDHKTKFDFDVQSCEYFVKRIGLTPTDIYGFNLFIDPEYRGKGIISEFLSKYFVILKESGYERNYGFVDKDNLAAYWTYKIVGCKDIETVKTRRFFLFFLFKNSTFFFDRWGLTWFFNTPEIYKKR